MRVIEKSIDTNQFWDNWGCRAHHEELAVQNGEMWENHFQSLFEKVEAGANCKQNQINKPLEELEFIIEDSQKSLDVITHYRKGAHRPS